MGLGGGYVTSWVGDPGAVTEYNVRFTAIVPVPNDGKGAELVFSGRIKSVDPESKSVTIALTATTGGKKIFGRAHGIGHVGLADGAQNRHPRDDLGIPGLFRGGPRASSRVRASDQVRRSGQLRRGSGRRTRPITASLRPLTFASIFAKLVQDDFFRNVDFGMETMQIVQVDQRFIYLRPLYVGDRIFGRTEVESVDERFGADIVVTKNTLTNVADGQVVLLAYTTLMGHEGDNSIPAQMGQGNRADCPNRVISI